MFSTIRTCTGMMLLVLLAFSQTSRPEVSLESAWSPTAEVLSAAQKECAAQSSQALVACFAAAMGRNGAGPSGVAFTKSQPEVVYIHDLHEAGVVDIAAVTRPFRANDTDGLLLVNGAPRDIDVDDLAKLPVGDLKTDAEYAQLLRTSPKALLLPGDRSSASAIDLISLANGGHCFVVEYRISDGCRACATLGHARFGFDFDAAGKLQGIRLVSFSPVGPEGQETSRNAPAPLEMTLAPKLVQLLYQATRETKEAKILEALAAAKSLIEQRRDIRAPGPQGRTALHWVIFGSASETRHKPLAIYEELAAALIAAGVDVNQEDQYQNTALDYLDYSPNHEMQTLLLEHGAVSGYFTGDLQERFVGLFERVEGAAQSGRTGKARQELTADLHPGQSISARLLTPVGSERSWTGDPISAVVTAPVTAGSRIILAPGTKLEGTVFYSQTAPHQYSQPRLVLDFANVLHPSGVRSPIFVRVTAVDNARETVRRNEITGMIQPHASTKAALGLRLVSFAHPGIAWAITGVRAVYGLSIRREIDYPAGTDLLLQITGPSKLRETPAASGWRRITADAELERLVQRSPLRTATAGGKPSDLTNLMLLGSRDQVVRAFEDAGWVDADRVTVKTSLKAFQATIRQSGYDQAPMSLLTIEGQAPDLTMQKGLNTFAKRHHLRIWKQPGQYRGRDIWISSSTHDTGIGVENGTKWFHRIDPRIDRERTKVQNDLLFTNGAAAYALIDRPRAPRKTENATGDALLTDGKMLVLWMADGSSK